MAIVSCTQLPDRGGSTRFQNFRLTRESTKKYRVKTDDKSHDDTYVLANAITATPDPLPNDLDSHPTQAGLYCTSRQASQETEGDGRSWMVTCQFDNSISANDASDAGESPLERRTRYRMESVPFTRVVERDEGGILVQNYVGDKFDPMPEEEDERSVLVATKNYDATDFFGLCAFIHDYRGAVNNDLAFTVFPPGTLRLSRISMSDLQSESDIEFYTVSWNFEFKEEYENTDNIIPQPGHDVEAWDLVLLNQGYSAYASADDASSKFTWPGKEPVKLADDGTVASSPDDYTFMHFRTKKRRPFSAIPI